VDLALGIEAELYAGDDVLVVELAYDRGLSSEACDPFLVGERGGEHLERHVLLGAHAPRLVDRAHAALAELGDGLVARDETRLAGLDRGGVAEFVRLIGGEPVLGDEDLLEGLVHPELVVHLLLELEGLVDLLSREVAALDRELAEDGVLLRGHAFPPPEPRGDGPPDLPGGSSRYSCGRARQDKSARCAGRP